MLRGSVRFNRINVKIKSGTRTKAEMTATNADRSSYHSIHRANGSFVNCSCKTKIKIKRLGADYTDFELP